jgi:hypothetical protein
LARADRNAIRRDRINSDLLGITRAASEESVRRATAAIPEQKKAKTQPLHGHQERRLDRVRSPKSRDGKLHADTCPEMARRHGVL